METSFQGELACAAEVPVSVVGTRVWRSVQAQPAHVLFRDLIESAGFQSAFTNERKREMVGNHTNPPPTLVYSEMLPPFDVASEPEE